MADTSAEEFYVRSFNIHPEMLRDTIGVLTLPVDTQRYKKISKLSASVVNPALYWGDDTVLIPEVHVPINSYQPLGNTFAVQGTLALAEMIPMSAMKYDGIASMRFPIVAQQGEYYRQIVYDPIRNLRTWIHLRDLAPLTDSHGEIREVYFTEHTFNEMMGTSEDRFLLPVTLFFLTNTRELYATPHEHSTFRLISPESPIFENEQESPIFADVDYESSYELQSPFYVAQISNGFALIKYVLCSHDGQDRKIVGWVKIRDNSQQLTIWLCDAIWCT